MRIRDLNTLSFLYDMEGYSWLRRHQLNRMCKKEIREAMVSGENIVAANPRVAEELHRYYRVPKEIITVLHNQE